MVGGKLYNAASSGSSLSVMLQNQRNPCASKPHGPFFISEPTPSFLGSRSMMRFEDIRAGNGSKRSFLRPFDLEESGDEELDVYFHQPGKKRRLTAEQVQFLEKSFEVENKLEPERKVQLAKDISLQPRQVAIWFQNRRARWKTKQLEKDYAALQASYDGLKADYISLLQEKDKLKAELDLLTDKLLLKGKDKENLKLSDTNELSQEPPQNPISDSVSEDEVSKFSIVACKQEDISSGKSNIFDSDSPHHTDGCHSSLLEHGDSSYVCELQPEPEVEQSDLSQDDNLSKSLLPSYNFPKLEDANHYDPPSNSGNFGFPVEDHPFWSWSY